MARYHGRAGKVYVSRSSTAVAASIGQLSEWSLDMGRDDVEVTAFADANKTYVTGLADIKGKFSGYWSDADDSLYVAADSADGCYVWIYPSTDAATRYWYGASNLQVSVAGGVSKAVSVDGSFSARGSWIRSSSSTT